MPPELKVHTNPSLSGCEVCKIGAYANAASAAAVPVTESVLRLSHISKGWRRNRVKVLDGIDLELPSASVVWIGGSNGAGKTTLLRIVAGVIMPDTGQVRVKDLGPERDRRAYQSHVSFLSTGNSGLYARMTVGQHLRYQSRLDLLPPGVGERVIEREFERLRLAEIDRRRVDRLSMGQRQRLRFAMTMLRDPTVLLLDEPGNSLDDDGVSMVLDGVAEIVDRGGVVVWCSPTDEGRGLEFDRRLRVEDGGLIPA
jgi:ABC-2 type transport system ATP-binding protein